MSFLGERNKFLILDAYLKTQEYFMIRRIFTLLLLSLLSASSGWTVKVSDKDPLSYGLVLDLENPKNVLAQGLGGQWESDPVANARLLDGSDCATLVKSFDAQFKIDPTVLSSELLEQISARYEVEKKSVRVYAVGTFDCRDLVESFAFILTVLDDGMSRILLLNPETNFFDESEFILSFARAAKMENDQLFIQNVAGGPFIALKRKRAV